jgi:hypothetical protein
VAMVVGTAHIPSLTKEGIKIWKNQINKLSLIKFRL